MLKFACRITGDDYQMLKSETTPSRKKVLTLGLTVLVPTIMWFINGYLMVCEVFGKSFFPAFFTGLVAASVIFLIEKLVVMSNGGWVLMLFRGVLAFLVALIGSVFMDEVIFAKDITQQLSANKEILMVEKQEQVKARFNEGMQAKEGEVQQKYIAWQLAQSAAEKEADGSGGSGIRGVHAIARLKLNNSGINQRDYLLAKTELETLLAKMKAEQEKQAAKLAAGFEDKALLNRIKAMFDLVKSDGYMMFFYLLVTAILFTLEFLVIVFKVTMGKTNYERRLELIEEIGKKRMEKISKNDYGYFDSSKVYPVYKSASNALQKIDSSSLFN